MCPDLVDSTTNEGSASSIMAPRSMVGSRAETGCGVARAFQTAIVASTNSMPLGRPIVTELSGVTPSSM